MIRVNRSIKTKEQKQIAVQEESKTLVNENKLHCKGRMNWKVQ